MINEVKVLAIPLGTPTQAAGGAGSNAVMPESDTFSPVDQGNGQMWITTKTRTTGMSAVKL